MGGGWFGGGDSGGGTFIGPTGGGGGWFGGGGGAPKLDWGTGGSGTGIAQTGPESFRNRFSIESTHGGGGGILGNLLDQAAGVIHGAPGAVETTVQTGWHSLHLGYQNKASAGWSPEKNWQALLSMLDISHQGDKYNQIVPDKSVPKSERGPGGLLSSGWWHDPNEFGGAVLTPQYEAAKSDVAHAKNRDWHYFYEHPLNPILDIATVASLGGKAALIGGDSSLAARGALGATAKEAATTERLLTDGNESRVLNQAQTIQGRIRQRAYDNWSMRHPDAKFIGASARMVPFLQRTVNNFMVQAHLPLRTFQHLTRNLNDAETFAFHVVVEPVTLPDRIAFYKAEIARRVALIEKREKRLAKRPPKTRPRIPPALRPLQKYLDNLESPAVRDAIEHPSQAFIDALEAGGRLEALAGHVLTDAGELNSAAREARVEMPARVMEPPAPPPPPAPPTFSGPSLPPTRPMTGGTPKPVMFTVRVPHLFWLEHEGLRSKIEGAIASGTHETGELGHAHRVGKPGRTDLRIRMDEQALQNLIQHAKSDTHKAGMKVSAKATLRKLKNQEHIIQDARDRVTQELQWRHKKGDYWRVEDSDITVRPTGPESTPYQVWKGEEPISDRSHRTVAEGKRAAEKWVEYRRSQASLEAAQTQTAAEVAAGAEEDPFLGPLDRGELGKASYAKLGRAASTEGAAGSVSEMKWKRDKASGHYSVEGHPEYRIEPDVRQNKIVGSKMVFGQVAGEGSRRVGFIAYRDRQKIGVGKLASVKARVERDIAARAGEGRAAGGGQIKTSHIPEMPAATAEDPYIGIRTALEHYAPPSELDSQLADSAYQKLQNGLEGAQSLTADEKRVMKEAIDSVYPGPSPRRTEAALKAAGEEPGLYHGTRERFKGDQPGDIYSTGSGANNLYGHGFYTTDSRDVAGTYTRKGGATEAQHVYRVHWQGRGKPKLLDLDKPAHPIVAEWGRAQLKEVTDGTAFDATQESIDALDRALKQGTSGDIIRAVRKMWGSTGEIPKSEVDDMVGGLSELLAQKGYDGLTHVGGVVTGKAKHKVSIFFDTKNLRLSDAGWFAEKAKAEERAAAEAAPAAEAPAEAPAASVSEATPPPTEETPPAAQTYELPERPAAETAMANVHGPMFPPHYRFPHMREGFTPGQFLSPQVERMLTPNTPLKQLRHNSAVLLTNALMITDPERVYGRDYLSTLRWQMIGLMKEHVLSKIARPLDPEMAATGFKPEGWWYYLEKPVTIPRGVRMDAVLTHDRSVLDAVRREEKMHDAAHGIVSKSLTDLLGPDAADKYTAQRLSELGVKMIPAAYGKHFRDEFTRTNKVVRMLYDRPMDVWRAITLNYRPAWLVNNFVGNGVMGLATYGPAGLAAYLRVLLSVEKSDEVFKLWGKTTSIPKLQRKYGSAFEEVAAQLHSAGLFGTQTHITHRGIHEGAWANLFDQRAMRAVDATAGQVGRGVLRVGRGITKAEILFAEDTSREASFLVEAGADIKRLQETARKMGEGNISVIEAMKRMDKASVERAVERVNDALGDFNNLNHFERTIIRRIIPFYSWFKVITKVSGKYLARYPARVLLVKNIGEARDASTDALLPRWLEGALGIGGVSKAGNQTVITTNGLNPYETLPQIQSGGWASLLSPVGGSALISASGKDPSFGAARDYYGLGASSDFGWKGDTTRFFGSLIQNLAPFQTAEKAHDYKGKLYAPHNYHAGPVTLDDFWLQYFGLPIRHINTYEARRERGLR